MPSFERIVHLISKYNKSISQSAISELGVEPNREKFFFLLQGYNHNQEFGLAPCFEENQEKTRNPLTARSLGIHARSLSIHRF